MLWWIRYGTHCHHLKWGAERWSQYPDMLRSHVMGTAAVVLSMVWVVGGSLESLVVNGLMGLTSLGLDCRLEQGQQVEKEISQINRYTSTFGCAFWRWK